MEESNSIFDLVSSQGYEVLEKFSSGSYSQVYLCKSLDEESGSSKPNRVACKVVDTLDVKAEFISKFFPRELDIVSQLKHPNVIQTLGIFHRGTKFFIFMRYAENRDLLEYILRHKVIPEDTVKFWACQIALALTYLHENQIVHRDLKCENILITANKNLKLSDFSFGKLLIDGEPSRTWCGSLAYAAPEILSLTPYNEKKVDSWAFGVVLYATLSRTMPFSDKTVKAILVKQTQRFALVGRKWDPISYPAKVCVTRLLEYNPKTRWSPTRVLSCNWLSDDPRIKKLLDQHNIKSSDDRNNPILVTVDKRRFLSILKKQTDVDVSSTDSDIYGRNFERTFSSDIDKSYNFFTIHSDVLQKEQQRISTE